MKPARLALIAVFVILLSVTGAFSMPYMFPNFTFAHSPFLSQVITAHIRGGWDFEGGWPHVHRRFPNAIKEIERKWIENQIETEEKKKLMEFAGTMFIEGLQVQDGLRVIFLGLKSQDAEIRERALYSLCYGSHYLGWQPENVRAYALDNGAPLTEVKRVLDIALGHHAPPVETAPDSSP